MCTIYHNKLLIILQFLLQLLNVREKKTNLRKDHKQRVFNDIQKWNDVRVLLDLYYSFARVLKKWVQHLPFFQLELVVEVLFLTLNILCLIVSHTVPIETFWNFGKCFKYSKMSACWWVMIWFYDSGTLFFWHNNKPGVFWIHEIWETMLSWSFNHQRLIFELSGTCPDTKSQKVIRRNQFVLLSRTLQLAIPAMGSSIYWNHFNE